MRITVIIVDESPLRWLGEPCGHRSVQIVLTPEQEEALRLAHGDERYSTCFVELVVGPAKALEVK